MTMKVQQEEASYQLVTEKKINIISIKVDLMNNLL